MRSISPGRVARRAAVLAALTVVAGSGVARAQAPPAPGVPPATPPAATAPDERAAAQQFAFAAYRLRVAVLAEEKAIEDRIRAITAPALGDPRCDRVGAAAPGLTGILVLAVELVLDITPAYDPVRPALDTFLAELEQIPTADPALRSGRAGWRSEIQFIRQLQSTDDPCGKLEAWRRAKFDLAASPVNIEAFDDPGLNAAEGKLGAAARRMQALGVSAGAAHRFTGDGVFKGVPLSLV